MKFSQFWSGRRAYGFPERFGGWRPFLAGLAIVLIALVSGVSLFSAQLPQAQAARSGFGFGPQAYKSGYNYGNGVFFAPYQFTVYAQPNEASTEIGKFRWSRKTNSNALSFTTPDGTKRMVYADHVFFCFYPELDVAMMAVTGDDEQGGWVEVVYDQSQHQTGWVRVKSTPKASVSDATGAGGSDSNVTSQRLAPLDTGEPAHFGVYQTWQEFMKLNAKASGIYWLSGVSEYQRSVRSSDADDAKLLPITIIRQLKVKHVRGNWMLVEVLDFERNTPIGWVRWRDDNGNLMVFPNISGEHLPIVTTAY
jgi:hypothetical protein